MQLHRGVQCTKCTHLSCTGLAHKRELQGHCDIDTRSPYFTISFCEFCSSTHVGESSLHETKCLQRRRKIEMCPRTELFVGLQLKEVLQAGIQFAAVVEVVNLSIKTLQDVRDEMTVQLVVCG